MKRTLYEWTAIFAGMFGLASLGYWGASFFFMLPRDKLNIPYAWLGDQPTATLANGVFEFCSDASSEGEILQPMPYFLGPTVPTTVDLYVVQYAHVRDQNAEAHATAFLAPGFAFRHCKIMPLHGWYIRVSTLMVGLVALLVAAFTFWQHRRLSRCRSGTDAVRQAPTTSPSQGGQ